MRMQVSEFSANQVLTASNNICCSSIRNDRKFMCALQKNLEAYENTSVFLIQNQNLEKCQET